MNLLGRIASAGEKRYSLNQYIQEVFSYLGHSYSITAQQTLTGKQESIESDFTGLVRGALKSNGIVFACMVARLQVFSAARFQFQRYSEEGQPGKLFGTTELAVLEEPWVGGTTQDLLAKLITDADIGGNAYLTRRGNRLVRMRPDWVDIILGSFTDESVDSGDLDAEVLGYVYYPGGKQDRQKREPVLLERENVAHFAPYPDPEASYRGMSWLTPVIREIESDRAATSHKSLFFTNGATPNLLVTFAQALGADKLKEYERILKEKHEGLANAYKTLVLANGADAKVLGSTFKEIEFSATQAAGETRIAVAAGVPATVLGISEGLQGSTLNAGNFGQARRSFADRTLDHLWKNAAGSMSKLVRKPAGTRLLLDTRYVPFLREDQKDEAEIQQIEAAAMNSLISAGFEPASVVQAVTSGDLTQLVHTGLVSVQLLPPGTQPALPTNGTNGKRAEQLQLLGSLPGDGR
jgi:phage portal protein BeeE